MARPMRTHPKADSGRVFAVFFFPSPHEAAVFPSVTVAKNMCGGAIRMSSSAKVLDLDGCFSSEKPYHDHGDCLVWTGPQ